MTKLRPRGFVVGLAIWMTACSSPPPSANSRTATPRTRPKPAIEYKRVLAIDKLARFDKEGAVDESLTLSPDGRHAAVVLRGKKGEHVLLDGQALAPYGRIAAKSLVMSGGELAYAVPRAGKWYLVWGGWTSRGYDGIAHAVRFAPGGKRLAWFARQGKQWRLFVTKRGGRLERTHGPYDGIGSAPIWSPDSRRVAFVARRGPKWLVVTGGKDGKPWDAIGRPGPRFSPDGRRVAYVVRNHGKWRVVVDGKPGRIYDHYGGGLQFSPDGRRIGYVAWSGGKAFAVIDGREARGFGNAVGPTLRFVRRGATWVPSYGALQKAGQRLVRGDKLGPRFDGLVKGSITVSPDGRRLAYIGRRGQERFLVVDGKELGRFPDVGGHPIFSPDSQRVALVVVFSGPGGDRWQVWLDGKLGPVYRGILRRTPIFSPDGKRLALVVRAKQGARVVIDDKPHAVYPRILYAPQTPPLAFDALGNLRYLAMRTHPTATEIVRVRERRVPVAPRPSR